MVDQQYAIIEKKLNESVNTANAIVIKTEDEYFIYPAVGNSLPGYTFAINRRGLYKHAILKIAAHIKRKHLLANMDGVVSAYNIAVGRFNKRVSLPGGVLVNIGYGVINLPELRPLHTPAVTDAYVLRVVNGSVA